MPKSILEQITIARPCNQSWDEMIGNDKVRFCSHCSKDVFNLSAITREQAEKLIADSSGKLCARYQTRADQKIISAPQQPLRITRHATFAAGLLAASIALSTPAYSQKGPNVDLSTSVRERYKSDVESKVLGTLKGVITDLNGALVPGAQVTLLFPNSTKVVARTMSDVEGRFEFISVEAETYDIEVSAQGFTKAIHKNIKIDLGEIVETNIVLSVNEAELVGELIIVEVPTDLGTSESKVNLDLQKRLVPAPPKPSKSKKP